MTMTLAIPRNFAQVRLVTQLVNDVTHSWAYVLCARGAEDATMLMLGACVRC
jgi:hypothetical protein